jgi:hypothetical protein
MPDLEAAGEALPEATASLLEAESSADVVIRTTQDVVHHMNSVAPSWADLLPSGSLPPPPRAEPLAPSEEVPPVGPPSSAPPGPPRPRTTDLQLDAKVASAPAPPPGLPAQTERGASKEGPVSLPPEMVELVPEPTTQSAPTSPIPAQIVSLDPRAEIDAALARIASGDETDPRQLAWATRFFAGWLLESGELDDREILDRVIARAGLPEED